MPEPRGEGIKVKVVSSSICGSDIHMLALDAFGDHGIGHEFAGVTPDGRAVAISAVFAIRGTWCIVRRVFHSWA